MNQGWLCGFVCASVIACTPAPPPPKKPAPPPPQDEGPLSPPPIPEFVPSLSGAHSAVAPRFPDDDGGVLIGGIRVTLDGELAPDTGVDGLLAGERVRKAWGGGFLFWNRVALYHASTFTGPLALVTPLSSQVKTISYGPGFMLVRTFDGVRFSLATPSRTVSPPSPIGLVDVAALSKGPAVALLQDGSAVLSTNQGKTWSAVENLQGIPSSVSVVEDRIWLELSSDARRLEPDGSWASFKSKPRAVPPSQSSGCGVEFPPASLLSAAVHNGVPTGDGIALAPLSGALVRVDLRTGQCLGKPRRIAPANAECDLVETKSDLLAVCTINSRGAIVFSNLLDDAGPRQEASFEGYVRFHEAGGHLIVDGPCEGAERTAGIVCIRDEKGRYQQYDRREEPLSGWIPRWIPKDDGGAIGFTTEPKPMRVDAVSGKRTALEKPDANTLRSLLSWRSNTMVDRRWHVTPDGIVHGWYDRSHVALGPEGLKTFPFSLSRVTSWGSRALGFDRKGHAWQTLDDGATWVEVLGPPSYSVQSNHDVRKCSAVGCDLQGWLRIGWRTTPPQARQPPLPRVPIPTRVFRRPTLACKRTGTVHFLSFPDPVDTDRGSSMLGLGARIAVETRGEVSYVGAQFMLDVGRDSSSDVGLRAFVHQREISDERTVGATRAVWYTLPFDPAPNVQKAQFSLRDIVASAPGNVDRRQWVRPQRGSTLPVLASSGTAGFVLTTQSSSPLFWVGGPATRGKALALGLEDLESEVLSAATYGKDELTVLVRDDSCGKRVLQLGTRSSRLLSSLPERPSTVGCPPNRDVLAQGPDGLIGVLRTPSGPVPPSAQDPALVLIPGRLPTILAPWSTLKPASDPACKGDQGYRAIVMTQGAWLDVQEDGEPRREEGMLALVSWSTQRVCLHAVEVDAGNWEPARRGLSTTMVAHFGDAPKAGRVAVGRGMELRIPMECALVQ